MRIGIRAFEMYNRKIAESTHVIGMDNVATFIE